MCAAVLLAAAAIAGVGWAAGYRTTLRVLEHPHWPWFLLALLGEGAAYGGYLFAFRGVTHVEQGPRLSHREFLAVVTAGFGGFVVRSGAAVDQHAFEATGESERQAKVRVGGLSALEHAPLAPAGCIAAIVLLLEGAKKPPLDFLYPWAIAPPIGFVGAFWLASRYRDAWRGRGGWREKASEALHAVWLLRKLASDPREHWPAFAGMSLYWAGDIVALGACLAAFRVQLGVAQLILGYAVGYVLTRRTAPLGGAGFVEAALPWSLYFSGAPLAVALLAVVAYRIVNLWLPMPFAFLSLPIVRDLGERHTEPFEAAPRTGTGEKEPALRPG
ncbi:MAG: hypothetical protein V7644_987 [Actinomycetota bacterium]